jgi:hypothetical protein
MSSLLEPACVHPNPPLRWLIPALLTAIGLLACADTRTAVCLNGVRCPVGLMCVEPYGYCDRPELVEPCLDKAEDAQCPSYLGFEGNCRRGLCELDMCAGNVVCNDHNPCTRDTCGGEYCQYEPVDGVSCEDGNFCNGADTCMAGICSEHNGDPCTRGNTYCDRDRNACAGCTDDADCPESIYGEWGDCTGADGTCSQDGLQTRTAVTFTCDSDSICQMNEGLEPRACMRSTDGWSCSDGNACTTNDQCSSGLCDGQAKVCNDGHECTVDTCNPEEECRFDPVPFGGTCGNGHCDGIGGCITCANVGQACSTGNPCERGVIRCVGGSPTCVAVGPAPAGTVCIAAAGACDLPEVCNGVDTTCPTNRFQQGTTCRPAAGTCDVAETCTGTSAFCPDDNLRSSGFTCRAATEACDIAETCTGTDPVCPLDRLHSPGFTCRGSAGVCDVAETCNGASAACPGDAFVGPATTCRPAIGSCDQAENCTGSSAACPGDVLQPSGTVCRAAVNECDVTEQCTGTSTSCPTNDPGCTTDEYCLDTQCFDRPTYDLQGGESDQCADQGIPHPPPAPLPPPSQPPSSGFASRQIIRGRPGAPFFTQQRHLSCDGPFQAPSTIDCYETGIGPDTVIPQGGTCTAVLFHDSVIEDCPNTIAGRWEQYAVVDGIESNHDFGNVYNTTFDCDIDSLPDSCAAAQNFCPCTRACTTNPCPSPGVCPSNLLYPDTWNFDDSDAGLFPDADTNFSTAEGAE